MVRHGNARQLCYGEFLHVELSLCEFVLGSHGELVFVMFDPVGFRQGSRGMLCQVELWYVADMFGRAVMVCYVS